MVQGGAMLFGSGIRPFLDVYDLTDEKHRGAPRLRSDVTTTRLPRGRVRHTADSAEAIRAIKASLGVPSRPTAKPVDEWSRN